MKCRSCNTPLNKKLISCGLELEIKPVITNILYERYLFFVPVPCRLLSCQYTCERIHVRYYEKCVSLAVVNT